MDTAPLGPTNQDKDSPIHRLGPANPGLPGSQSNAAAARRHGSRSRVASSQERVDTHGASSQDDPARTPPLELPESMHMAHRYGMETTTLRRLLPVDAHSARPGTTTRKGAGSKRRDTSAPCCSPDGPALGGALLAPTTQKDAGSKRRDISAPCCSPDSPALGGALLAPSLIS